MVERLLASPAYARARSSRCRACRSRCAMSTRRHIGRIRGVPPAYDTPDEDVYLAGRNLVLLTKAGVVASKAKAHRIAPRAACRQSVSRCASRVLHRDGAGDVARARSSDRDRDAVSRRGKRRMSSSAASSSSVPFELTLSCMNPVMHATACRSTVACAASAASGVMRLPPPACQTRAPTRTDLRGRNRREHFRIANDRGAQQADRRANRASTVVTVS